MRVLILILSVFGILISADAATSGPSTTNRDLSASVDPATFTDEATQETEDQIGLDNGKLRDVQRRLTGLGFDTKVTFFVLIPCKSPRELLMRNVQTLAFCAGEAQLAELRRGAVVEA
jgi:hypothetical protein